MMVQLTLGYRSVGLSLHRRLVVTSRNSVGRWHLPRVSVRDCEGNLGYSQTGLFLRINEYILHEM